MFNYVSTLILFECICCYTGEDLKKVLSTTHAGAMMTSFIVCCHSSVNIDQTGATRQYSQRIVTGHADLGIIFASTSKFTHSLYIPEWKCTSTLFMYALRNVLRENKNVTNLLLLHSSSPNPNHDDRRKCVEFWGGQ
jgi:hypothetical protein